jgi:quercetin dioxygenase-like cupin family protein
MNERILAPSKEDFIEGDSVVAEPVSTIEGAAEMGDLAIKALMVTDDVLVMEVRRGKGLVDPDHAHADHESICYLVSGRMRVIIDGEEFLAGPGDTWRHRPGITHHHEALEDCVQLEIKAPPRKTWG